MMMGMQPPGMMLPPPGMMGPHGMPPRGPPGMMGPPMPPRPPPGAPPPPQPPAGPPPSRGHASVASVIAEQAGASLLTLNAQILLLVELPMVHQTPSIRLCKFMLVKTSLPLMSS